MGLLLFGVSYYLLPVDAIHCRDMCGQGQTWDYTTMGQLSRYALSAWQYEMNAQPQFSSSVVLDTILLVAHYLPLLAAVTVVGCSVGFLVRLHRTFTVWGHRAWLTGELCAHTHAALRLVWCRILCGGTVHRGSRTAGRVWRVVERQPCLPRSASLT
jgi:hypothetical protein